MLVKGQKTNVCSQKKGPCQSQGLPNESDPVTLAKVAASFSKLAAFVPLKQMLQYSYHGAMVVVELHPA
jgi:hypothetical protein